MKAFFVGAVLLSPFVAIGCGGGGGDCTSHASTFCQENVTYWSDDCGNLEEVKENCDCGCNSDHTDCMVKDCTGRICGPDPICGESCGTCPGTDTCNEQGQCVSSCTPSCAGRECGWDPICGTMNCGSCAAGESCNAQGQCECKPSCAGRECGWDPICGTMDCGTCSGGSTCNAQGQCVADCVPNCSGHVCGMDPVCGTMNCGTCTGGDTCNAQGQCVSSCTPNCTGRICGPDPVCGQSCGTCTGALECVNGECICIDDYDCDENSICLVESCSLAYGRNYTLTVVSVEVSQYDQNGEAWDSLGGMPDPFVCWYKNKDSVSQSTVAEFCTTAEDDIFNPTFNESFQAIISASDKWGFVVWDQDLTDDDWIEGWYLDPIPVSVIKEITHTINGEYALEVVIAIEPAL